jgi:hypothetical protein
LLLLASRVCPPVIKRLGSFKYVPCDIKAIRQLKVCPL